MTRSLLSRLPHWLPIPRRGGGAPIVPEHSVAGRTLLPIFVARLGFRHARPDRSLLGYPGNLLVPQPHRQENRRLTTAQHLQENSAAAL